MSKIIEDTLPNTKGGIRAFARRIEHACTNRARVRYGYMKG